VCIVYILFVVFPHGSTHNALIHPRTSSKQLKLYKQQVLLYARSQEIRALSSRTYKNERSEKGKGKNKYIMYTNTCMHCTSPRNGYYQSRKKPVSVIMMRCVSLRMNVCMLFLRRHHMEATSAFFILFLRKSRKDDVSQQKVGCVGSRGNMIRLIICREKK